MRDETISAIIDAVNLGIGEARVFRRPLFANVEIAKVWVPDTSEAQFGDYLFFLIFSDGECAAAVIDMVCDLHAFTKEKFRRCGLMKQALKDIILPYLRKMGRDKQEITCGTEEGRRLSLSVGFEVNGNGDGCINLADVENVDFPTVDPPGFDKAKVDQLKFRIRSLATELAMIGDEVDCALGPNLTQLFKDQRYGIRALANDLSCHWQHTMFAKSLLKK